MPPEDPIQPDHLLESADELQAQFEALVIPPNIDPRLLALWMQREQDEIEHRRRKYIKPPRTFGRSLNRLFAAYIGISVMCLAIVLGLIQGQEPAIILKMSCIAFLVYTLVGAFVGLIAERCVNDSVETLLREIVHRSRETGQQNAEQKNNVPTGTQS